MRRLLICVAALALVSACSKGSAPSPQANAAASPSPSAASPAPTAPAAAAPSAGGPAVSGTFTVDGKPANLTNAAAYKGEPFDNQPITELVLSEKDQGGDAQAATDALFGKFGDAIVARITPDGSVVGADVIHKGLKTPSVSVSGVLKINGWRNTGGEVSGELTSNGPNDLFGQQANVDLTFHVKAPA